MAEEIKKSKVLSVKKMGNKDTYQNVSYLISFENKDSGWYKTKDENQTKFKEGEEIEYKIEGQTGKSGKVYYKISLPQQMPPFKGGFKPAITFEQQKELEVARQRSIEKQAAFEKASQYVNTLNMQNPPIKTTEDEVIKIADKYLKWFRSNE